jgi:hypothetical protein
MARKPSMKTLLNRVAIVLEKFPLLLDLLLVLLPGLLKHLPPLGSSANRQEGLEITLVNEIVAFENLGESLNNFKLGSE